MGLLKKDSTTAATITENVSNVESPTNSPAVADAISQNFIATTSTPDPSTTESTASLLTPPNIHINHMYVYNLTPDHLESPIKKVALKFQSPAASSGPICRICHEGDAKEDLVSPCRCAGTVGLVHLTCMERWLSTRCTTNDKCEICNYTFATIRSPKSLLEWIRSDENDDHSRRSLIGDVTCFFLLTPLAVVSSFLCVEGAKRQVMWGNSLEAGCLMALATFLITIYFVWNTLTFRYHFKSYIRWRSRNHNVKLVRVQRVSTAVEEGRNNSNTQDVQSALAAANRSGIVSIPVFEDVNSRSISSNQQPHNSHVSDQVLYSANGFGYADIYTHFSSVLESTV